MTDSLAMPIDAADSTHASDASWQAAMNSGWLEWVSPLYARDHSANDSFAQAIEAGGGATVGEFQNILNRYFNNRSSWSGGDATGFVSAANFFRVFGIAAAGGCGVGLCSRTHGLASDGANGIHDASGQILVGHIGYFIVGHPRADGSNDTEIGSSLVHQGALAVTATPAAATVTPEPATITLTASGLIGLAGFARRRRKKAAVQAAV